MKTYIILGGNGVFGVHNAIYLLKHADVRKVICVGRNSEKPEAYSLNVGKGDRRYEYHQIHVVFEQDRLFELFDKEKPEVIINYSALAHATSWHKSFRYYETNVTSLARMTEELAKRDYLQRWIQIGTSELYGSMGSPAKEDSPLKPTSPYAVSKMAGDLHLLTFVNVVKFPMNIIRPSNCYGPGQQLHRILPRAVLCGLTGQKMPLHGGGAARKSFMHAQDLAHAVYLISEKAPLGKVYNAGPENSISMRDLVAKTAQIMKVPFEKLAEITPGRAGEDANYWLDSSAIKKDLDWAPKISLEEGLSDMVAWGRRYLEFLKQESTEFVLRA
jgi:dTDP-glucose 4,6-dehydratase